MIVYAQRGPLGVTRASDRERAADVKLYWITLPELNVKRDWRAVHGRLLDDFAEIEDVLPTTMTATVLILYQGPARLDRWLRSIEVAVRRGQVRSRPHLEAGAQTSFRS